MKTLVAMTDSSRLRNFPTSRPVARSLAPAEYVSAVSKNVTPPSTAARTMGSAASSSMTQGRSLPFPNPIIPRQILETLRPDVPKFV